MGTGSRTTLLLFLVFLCAGCLQRRSEVAPPVLIAPPHIDPTLQPEPQVQTDAPAATAEEGLGQASDTPAETVAPAPAGILAAQQRVRLLTDQLLAANPKLGVKPSFFITDQPDPHLQRRDFERVFLSEGLIRELPSDGQLAALLSLQLAEMYTQRRREIAEDWRWQRREPPPTVPMIRENGTFGNPDNIHLTEIATLGLDQRQRPPEPLRNPWEVASEILVRAGYSELELHALPQRLQQWGITASLPQ